MKHVSASFAVALATCCLATGFGPNAALARDHQTHQAKIALSDARATALARAPGTVVDEELEHERGRWIYSFEIRPQGEKGKLIEEVNVDADSGVIVDVHTEKD